MRWGEFAAAEPVFAAEIRRSLEAGKHNYLATIREDGAPRISGTELNFSKDGADLWIGAMPASRKVRDLRRDPRLALHGQSAEPPDWTGDGKVAGTALPACEDHAKALLAEYGYPTDREGIVFLVDLTEAVITRVGEGGEHLEVTLWKQDRPLRTMQVS